MSKTVKFNVEILERNLIKDELDDIEIEQYMNFVQDKNNSNFEEYTLNDHGQLQTKYMQSKSSFYMFNLDEFSLTMSYQLEFDFV